MSSERAESWAELQELLFGGVWNDGSAASASDAVFRGEGRASNELTTSLQRLGGTYAELERHLLRNFRKYAHRDAVPRESTWHWLALAKHHGLPTRLLDWSHSPYVALHFATENAALLDQDGVVWAVDYVRAGAAPARASGRSLRRGLEHLHGGDDRPRCDHALGARRPGDG